MQWYECLQTGSEGMNLLFERRDINLGLLQCALPPKAGWQMPNPKLDRKKFISSVFFNAFLIYGTLCGFVNCQLVSFMSASVGALCLGQLQRVGCLFFLGKGIAGTDKILLVEKKERWENQSCL